MELTPKQQRFCEYYAKSGNGAESVRLAGYKTKNSDAIAHQLLGKTTVCEYLKTLTQPETDRRIADAVERQQFLTSMMRGEIIDSDDYVKNADRVKACVELGKLQGDYIERHQVESVVMPSVIELISG
jgi:phage terminase small subunit